MLTLKELYSLLAKNEILLQVEVQKGMAGSFQHLLDLTLHRAVIKDSIIEALEAKITILEEKKEAA